MLYLLLIGRIKERKKKKRNDWGAFFPPGAGHVLLAVLLRIFMDVSCN
jgi:hypothetical protein